MNSTTMVSIGPEAAEFLKSRRKTLHLSQEALALLAGVSRPSITRLERGRLNHLNLNTLTQVAKALQLHVTLAFQDEIP